MQNSDQYSIPTVIYASDETLQRAERLFPPKFKNFLAIPILQVKPRISEEEFKYRIESLPEMDFVIFSSPNAAKMFNALCEASKTRFYFGDVKVIATGDKTASTCRDLYIDVDFLPKTYSAAGIVKMLEEMEIKNKNVLIPKSAKAGSFLTDEISKLGAEVFAIDTYTVEPPNQSELRNLKSKLELIDPQLFIFTSPSAFEFARKTFCCGDIDKVFKSKYVAAIGDKTASALFKEGIKNVIIPETYTLDGLLRKLTEYFKTPK